jgi:ribosomal protein S18 acetylase RimI-like enzyme
VILRPARSTDAGKVGAILSAFVDGTDWMPRLHSRAEDVAWAGVMIDRGWVTVAEDDNGQVAGFIASEGGFIHALYVAPGPRRGIGRTLLDAAKTKADRLELWTFSANAQARRFYERQGFAEVETSDGAGNDEGLPDVRLVWHKESTA